MRSRGYSTWPPRPCQRPTSRRPTRRRHNKRRCTEKSGVGGIDPSRDRVVVFVGKLIASKGVDLLLAAWPLVLQRVPDARLLVVGFGAFRSGLESLAQALGRGDLAAARAPAGRGRAAAAGARRVPRRPPRRGGARLLRRRRRPPGRVHWAGRLEHAELADVLPAAEAMAVPSTFPEAFGMVAAEAAACGAFPVVAAHSGLAEVARSLAGRGARTRAPVAHLRGRPAERRAARRRAGRVAHRPAASCGRRRARRSSAWRAPATRGKASRAPSSPRRRGGWTSSPHPDRRSGLRRGIPGSPPCRATVPATIRDAVGTDPRRHRNQ